ncbi:hypothetical protein D4764_21G0001780 [Takifugu flavidus]|uniref:Uncharacterized protein n=1 Tax=Takifugu flavidus TaxID=433684 RepID=A0A5C6NEH6_9TELE|nr:hypothetical protein D4764_21G0001780 [Takifugu flavidus]
MLPQIRREPSLLLRRALEEGQKENLGDVDSENESLRRTLGHRSASPSGFDCVYTMDYKLCATLSADMAVINGRSRMGCKRFNHGPASGSGSDHPSPAPQLLL